MKLGLQVTFTCDDTDPKRKNAASAYDITLSRYPDEGDPPREIGMALSPSPCESVSRVGESPNNALRCAMATEEGR